MIEKLPEKKVLECAKIILSKYKTINKKENN